MSLSAEAREQVRRRFSCRCGYCGVHEQEVGSVLEIDHFKPRAHDGADDLDNLIYCCPACNRFKGDYWPSGDATTNPRRLLHPLKDRMQEHLKEDNDGLLTALSEVGAFHIYKLHLNRPQLQAARSKRRLRDDIYATIAEALTEIEKLNEGDEALAGLLNRVFLQIQRIRNL